VIYRFRQTKCLGIRELNRKGGKEARQPQSIHYTSTAKLSASQNGVRVESFRSHVSYSNLYPIIESSCSSMRPARSRVNKYLNSYNKYLSVAARVVRRSLKEEERLQAERRGQMELRFAKWSVSGFVVMSGMVEEGILADWAIDTERKARREQKPSGCQCCCYG